MDLDRAIDRAADKLDRLQEKASSVDIGGATSRSSGVGRGGLKDPWLAKQEATDSLLDAQNRGISGDALRPYQLSAVRATMRADRADRDLSGETRLDQLAKMSKGGIFPFVRQAATMLGTEGLAAVGGAYAAYQTLEAASNARSDLGSAFYAGGGTEAQTGSISMLGRFLGRSAEASAGAAVGFGNALHQSTYGAGYFRSQGIVDFGGLTVNKDQNYLRAVRMLADEPNRDIATRVARDTGLTSELWLRDLSAANRDRLLNDMGDTMGPEGRRSEARYKLRTASIGSWWGRQVRAGGDIISNIYDLDAGIGDILRADFKGAGEHFNAVRDTQGYDEDEYVQATFRGKKIKDLSPKERAEYDRLYGHLGRGVNVRTTPGQVGGGRRVAESLPLHARSAQLDQNLRGYGNWIGGYTP